MTASLEHDGPVATGCRPMRRALPILRAAVAALVVLSFGLDLPQARAATPIQLSTDASDGFARLELRFPGSLPPHEIRVTTGVIVVRFEAPVDIDVSRLASGLPSYVSAARLDPDGSAVRFALAQPVTVNSMEAGDRLFVDLLPRDWVGRPPGLPQEVIDELARRAAEARREREEEKRQRLIAQAEEISLRISHLPTFTRFVFVWNEAVDARLERSVNEATVAFDRFGRLDTAGMLVLLPEFVTAIRADNGADGLEVRLSVDPAATVRGFREDDTYVVDVGVPPGVEAGPEAAIPEAPAGASEEVRTFGDSGSEAPPPAEVDGGGAVAVRFDQFEDPAGAIAERPEGGDVLAVRPEARRFGSSVRVVFPFEQETPGAVFERAGTLWLVFDTAEELDTALLRADLGDFVTDVDITRGPDRAVVRLRLARAAIAAATAEATSWVVTIGDATLDPPEHIAVSRRLDADGDAEVMLDLPGAARLHDLRDDNTGERLAVVTAAPPAQAMVKPRNFVDFTAMATVHGVAIRRIADDLAVAVSDPEVVVSREGGLVVSEVGDGLYSPADDAERAVQRPGFVDLNSDAVLDPGVVHGLISGYIRAAARAEDEDRTAARMQLARALLATDLGAEALAQLALIVREDPAALRSPEVRALRGIALTMMRRPNEALDEFDAYGLSQSSDVALWRTVAEAERGDWRASRAAFERGEPALASYSDGRRLMFGLVAARAAIELREPVAGLVTLAQARDLAEPDDPRVTLLDGRLAELQGATRDALQAYDAVIATGDRMLGAEARLRATKLRHHAGRMKTAEAIAELERLSIVWRGDDIELTTLRLLAGLHVEQGDFREAFRLMKSATIAAPESSVTRGLQDDMNLAFESLFLKGQADEMPPVEALALYYDFRELTPIGRKGDEIIRRLADRLIEVDLLDQASELLAHQVQHRLKGAARAQVAATLAMVHMMNRKPDEALVVLARSRQQVLPASVQRQRMLIEARALAETGRLDLALDMMSALDGDDVRRMRADTLWRAESWQQAAELYEEMLGDAWSGGSALDEEARSAVMRAAIAYARGGDMLGLERLRGKYLAKMAESPDARGFDVVTRPMPGTEGAFREVVARLADTDTLDAFLSDYRERYGAARLDAAPQS